MNEAIAIAFMFMLEVQASRNRNKAKRILSTKQEMSFLLYLFIF